eukprot:TRINITY_DN9868_c0_g1_i2.p4 TRINITY_DN9868_c0_g1~~TRINITY_DN9868_c0_g1_i2.p4  ORF type:complete len:110 (+),score=2.82 TRINITY_DN9868_c0_g1_i2:206-535(+)
MWSCYHFSTFFVQFAAISAEIDADIYGVYAILQIFKKLWKIKFFENHLKNKLQETLVGSHAFSIFLSYFSKLQSFINKKNPPNFVSQCFLAKTVSATQTQHSENLIQRH